MRKIVAGALVVTMLTGCATQPMGENYVPIVDMKGKDAAAWTVDLSECQQYAKKVSGAAERAAAGAVAGAIFGALLMAAAGGKGYRNEAAAVGALTGAAEGAVHGERDQRKIITTCLNNRGYSVLS